MSFIAAIQFMRENASLLALLLAGFLAITVLLLLFLRHRARRRKQKQQGLAACWHATLSELSSSLNSMQAATYRLIRNRQRPGPIGKVYKSDVLVHRWLSEGFVLMAAARGYDCKGLVKSMQKDITLFNWNINEATNARLRGHGVIRWNQANRDKLQKLVDVFDNAAIRLACNRHKDMVRMWLQSAELLKAYCHTNNLLKGNGLESPGDIPLEWQMDESQPWMIKNLAPVGDESW